MKLKEFIIRSPIIDTDRIYTVGNPYFHHLCGYDLIREKKFPLGYNIINIGLIDRPLENTIPNHGEFKSVLKKIGAARAAFSIILGKNHWGIDQTLIDSLPLNVSFIASCNINTKNERALYLPLGCDFRSRMEAERCQIRAPTDRNILCYANFSINTHEFRVELAENLRTITYVKCDHFGKFLSYDLTREEFFNRLARSKFAICPRGMGIETFRMWDCLYLGVIPIVKREAVFMEQLDDLPIYFVSDWKKFFKISESELENIYDHYLEQNFNYEKLKLNYWIDKVYQFHVKKFNDIFEYIT